MRNCFYIAITRGAFPGWLNETDEQESDTVFQEALIELLRIVADNLLLFRC